MTPRRAPWREEDGSATAYVLGIILAVAVVAVLVAGLIQAHSASGRARAAADLAALGAARAWTDPLADAEPCAVAERVATADGARLTACRIDGQDVEVAVSVSVHLLGVDRHALAQARAGPVDEQEARGEGAP